MSSIWNQKIVIFVLVGLVLLVSEGVNSTDISPPTIPVQNPSPPNPANPVVEVAKPVSVDVPVALDPKVVAPNSGNTPTVIKTENSSKVVQQGSVKGAEPDLIVEIETTTTKSAAVSTHGQFIGLLLSSTLLLLPLIIKMA